MNFCKLLLLPFCQVQLFNLSILICNKLPDIDYYNNNSYFCYMKKTTKLRTWDSSVGITTNYGLEGQCNSMQCPQLPERL
jgi:hypothetical protein